MKAEGLIGSNNPLAVTPDKTRLTTGVSYVAPGWRPPVGVAVRVAHAGREEIAYVDGQGKWRKETNGDVLRGQVSILGLRGFSDPRKDVAQIRRTGG